MVRRSIAIIRIPKCICQQYSSREKANKCCLFVCSIGDLLEHERCL